MPLIFLVSAVALAGTARPCVFSVLNPEVLHCE